MATDHSEPVQAGKGRIAAIDVARAAALVAMAVYHFTWDLEFFGYARQGLTGETGWRLFARAIASSFLFLVGISLFLAHGRQIRWTSWRRRFAMIAAAAGAITAVTWLATPDSFIFFGILHQIALASLLGLAFLRLPWPAIAVLAIAVVALPQLVRLDAFAHPALLWTGLAPVPPRSNDYVPLFPWFGAVLAGMAAARIATETGLLERLRGANSTLPDWAGWLGRHSLAVYLIHQPVLIACVWAFAQFWPPPITIGDARPACEQRCQEDRPADFCTLYCLCVLEGLERDGILRPVLTGTAKPAQLAQRDTIAAECVAQGETERP